MCHVFKLFFWLIVKLNKKLNQEMQAAKVCAAVENIKSKAESRTITVPQKNGYICKYLCIQFHIK